MDANDPAGTVASIGAVSPGRAGTCKAVRRCTRYRSDALYSSKVLRILNVIDEANPASCGIARRARIARSRSGGSLGGNGVLRCRIDLFL